MLSSHKVRRGVGISLLAVVLLGLAFAGGRELVRETRRHVVVEVFNVNSVAQVFVNCRQAAMVGRRKPGATVDLGWLRPEDRVFLSATSRDATPSWGLAASGNGTAFFEEMRGNAEVVGFPAEPDAVVFAKAFTADGEYLGQIGCQPAKLVEPIAVPEYVQSPDDAEVSEVEGDDHPYAPPRAPYERIDAIGSWSLTALAVLGVVAAIGIEPVRRLAWSHRKLAGSALGLLATVAGLFFGVLGVTALLTTLKVSGILLLFAVALFLTLPAGKAGLEGTAGAGGTEA